MSFWYKDNDGVKHSQTMKVFGFMDALLQHIPDRQFIDDPILWCLC